MKGFVPTPDATVDLMVNKLFRFRSPGTGDIILDPGCGDGVFIQGIIRWCERRLFNVPSIMGVELDPKHAAVARRRFKDYPSVIIEERDFLVDDPGTYDFVIANPPYVPITGLSEDEKQKYRSRYLTAKGRFDLYILFFEQALRNLRANGRLVFVTPEKFTYVDTASPLRKMLAAMCVEEIHLISEETFGGLVTYPTITTVLNRNPCDTLVITREGRIVKVRLPTSGESWLPHFNGAKSDHPSVILKDLCTRISCGVATGADSVFVKRTTELDSKLKHFGYPTIAGRQIEPNGSRVVSTDSMLVPYAKDGRLLPEKDLGELFRYLSQKDIKARLLKRTCVSRKPWYAFHETPPLADILKPKILCKDISAKPVFVVDSRGVIVPRHSVYYIVPKNANTIDELARYLNSEAAREWLMNHCQRAAGGFFRVQSQILKRLPVPSALTELSEKTREPASNRLRQHQPTLRYVEVEG